MNEEKGTLIISEKEEGVYCKKSYDYHLTVNEDCLEFKLELDEGILTITGNKKEKSYCKEFYSGGITLNDEEIGYFSDFQIASRGVIEFEDDFDILEDDFATLLRIDFKDYENKGYGTKTLGLFANYARSRGMKKFTLEAVENDENVNIISGIGINLGIKKQRLYADAIKKGITRCLHWYI